MCIMKNVDLERARELNLKKTNCEDFQTKIFLLIAQMFISQSQ